MRIAFVLVSIACCVAALAQDAPKFEIASVHASAKSPNPFPRMMPPRNGRYEIRTASMVDLIQNAWGFQPDKIVGGPSWLEMDRFDVNAKVADKTSAEDLKLMVQSLLTERFGLVVRKESRQLPAFALTVGKKVLMKESDGAGDSGCRAHAPSGIPAEGNTRLMMNGAPLTLGPGNTIEYSCRNMTMDAFASGMRNMLGAGVAVGNNPVIDKTGLAGKWNFDVKWSVGIGGNGREGAEQVFVSDAIEKQLGLKLEQIQVATPVLVVEKVNETPTPDSPEVAKALPTIAMPTAFEVVDIRPADPEAKSGSMGMQAGGRFTARNIVLRTLVLRALGGFGGLGINADAVIGVPAWADSERFDITAKAPADAPQLDFITMAPLLRSVLEERFGLKAHNEERPLNAYSLVLAKAGSAPKMKKADPASRTHCVGSNGPSGSPAGTQVLTCQNFTMAQLADQLRNMGPGLNWPVLNSTGLEGGWDFVLTFNNQVGTQGPGEPGAASDPTGGYTVFEAVERQLGLKLEMQKRSMPVVVIDHLDEKPTEN